MNGDPNDNARCGKGNAISPGDTMLAAAEAAIAMADAKTKSQARAARTVHHPAVKNVDSSLRMLYVQGAKQSFGCSSRSNAPLKSAAGGAFFQPQLNRNKGPNRCQAGGTDRDLAVKIIARNFYQDEVDTF